jgi:hypothetical protein
VSMWFLDRERRSGRTRNAYGHDRQNEKEYMGMTDNNPDSSGRHDGQASELGKLSSFVVRNQSEILIFLFFLGLSIALTWPLIIKFNSSIYGWPADNLGGIWSMWWVKHASSFGGSASFTRMLGYPFGTRLPVISPEFVNDLVARFLLLFTNEIIVNNLFLFFSFLLSGITMYYLVRHLTNDKKAAFLGGTAFLVVTFRTYHGMSIPVLAFTQWMPLFILALLMFTERRSWKWAVLAGLAWLLVVATNIHFGFFMAVFVPSFFIGRYIYLKYRQWREASKQEEAVSRRPKLDRALLLKTVVVVLVLMAIYIPFLFLQLGGSSGTDTKWLTSVSPGISRADYNIDWGGANIYDYFTPCSLNPVFGPISNSIVGTRQAYQESVYLGWSLLILALIGLFIVFMPWFKIRPRAPDEIDAPSPVDSEASEEFRGWKPYMIGFLVAGIVAFLLSLSPHISIGSVRIPGPSWVFRYVSWFRWYMRFAIVVIICVIVLACYGLTALLKYLQGRNKQILAAVAVIVVVGGLEYAVAAYTHGAWRWVLAAIVLAGIGLIVYLLYGIDSLLDERGRGPLWPYVITTVAALLVILEMIIVPPARSYDFSHVPEVYTYMSKQADSTYVFYPAFEPGYFKNSQLMFFQRFFKKPMLNGMADNTDAEAVRRTVYNPYDPGVFSYLARFGINHIVLMDNMFAGYEGHDTVESLNNKLPRGVKREAAYYDMDDLFGYAKVFKVTAAPAQVVPILQGEISVPHIDAGLVTTRLLGSKGVIRLVNFSGHDLTVNLDVPLTGLGSTRHVTATAGQNTLAVFMLAKSENTVMRIANLKVPSSGLLIDLKLSGALIGVDAAEQALFGVGSASASMGSLTLTVAQ